MPFFKESEFKAVDAAPGITRRLVTAGQKTMAVRFALAKGSILNMHTHPHEQVGFVLSGALQLTIGDETHLIRPGDSYAVPSGSPHCATAVEDSIVVDIFSPVREEYL